MTRPLFDVDNDNNNNKHYPLFLGKELGLMDNIHVSLSRSCTSTRQDAYRQLEVG